MGGRVFNLGKRWDMSANNTRKCGGSWRGIEEKGREHADWVVDKNMWGKC